MSAYRVARPVIVDAVQCAEAKTIVTDLGFVNVQQGEWIVSGEAGECYVVDDAFFRRTFISLHPYSSASQAGNPGPALQSPQPARGGTGIPARTNCDKDRIRLTIRRWRNRCRRPAAR